MKQFLIKSKLVLMILAISLPLLSEAKTISPEQLEKLDWLEVPLNQNPNNPFNSWYAGSLAQSIFFRREGKDFLPPVQQFRRKFVTLLDANVTSEILNNLGLDPRSKKMTIATPDYFTVGARPGLPVVFQNYSFEESSTVKLVTCIVFVKDGNDLRAFYAEGVGSLMSGCESKLKNLLQTAAFPK